MDTRSTQARLRRTFAFPPNDGDDDAIPSEGMDEEEQENLISTLKTTNDSTNELYVRVFTALPLLCILPFVFHLVTTGSRWSTVLLPAIMAVTSLGVSSFVMGMVPLGQGLAWVLGRPPSSASMGTRGPATLSDVAHLQSQRRQQRAAANSPSTGAVDSVLKMMTLDRDSPVFQYILPINTGLSVVLLLYAWVFSGGKSEVVEGFWMLLLVPPVMFGVVMVVRASIVETEKGLGELEGMRYGYKGA